LPVDNLSNIKGHIVNHNFLAEKFSINTPDKELVHEYVDRSNIDAFGLIYEKYVKDVYRIVYMRVGRQTAVDDIVSETFLTLMKVLENYRFDSQLKTFIIGIAINKVRQHWQKQQHEALPLNEELVLAEPDDVEPEVEDYKIEIARDVVQKILGQLEYPYADVLKARFIEGKSIKETADKLKLSEVNIRVIQHRALRKAAPIADQIKKNG
jgi:RNA polymerase sigma-70 factor (ECF subfamily)